MLHHYISRFLRVSLGTNRGCPGRDRNWHLCSGLHPSALAEHKNRNLGGRCADLPLVDFSAANLLYWTSM